MAMQTEIKPTRNEWFSPSKTIKLKKVNKTPAQNQMLKRRKNNTKTFYKLKEEYRILYCNSLIKGFSNNSKISRNNNDGSLEYYKIVMLPLMKAHRTLNRRKRSKTEHKEQNSIKKEYSEFTSMHRLPVLEVSALT